MNVYLELENLSFTFTFHCFKNLHWNWLQGKHNNELITQNV